MRWPRDRTGCVISQTGDMFERLHHTQLAMPPGREGDARDFYVGVLEMREIDKPPVLAARGGAWFRAGGVELHLGVEEGFQPGPESTPGDLGPRP